MPANKCVGNPTFNEIYGGAISEWPENLPGIICKTPPIGTGSAPRFAQCCSGPVYNITSPTSPDDPAYPVSCATLCQISPALDASNYKYPYHWSDHFMCLTDGGTEPSNWEVACATISVKGNPAPTSFVHTPTGSWQTRSYSLDDPWFPEPTTEPVLSSTRSDSTSVSSTRSSTPTASQTGLSETALPSSLTSPPPSPSISSSQSSLSGTETATAPATTTSTSSGEKLSVKRAVAAVFVICTLCVGWGSV